MNFKTTSLLVVIIVGLCFVIFRYHNLYSRMKSQKDNIQLLYSKKMDEVDTYRNRFNNVVTRNEAIQLENRTIKALVKDGELAQLKQLEGLNRRMNNLEFAYKITARALDSVRIHLQDTSRFYIDDKGDTVLFKSTSFRYTDKWASFKGVQVSPDSLVLNYSINAPLTGAMYWKRKTPILWIFSKKEYWSEITSENPHVQIPELLTIKALRKK
jgi:hypothetical protein